MKLARPYRSAPLEIAMLLAAKLGRDAADGDAHSPIDSAEAAPPGFLNMRLRPDALEGVVDGILAAPDDWGRVAAIRPRSVNVEFVSANPTGPLTIGNARGAFIGDLLSRFLEAGGQDVTREYYFNDPGGQIDKLGASVLALRRGGPVPDDGYHGDYVGGSCDRHPGRLWSAATGAGRCPGDCSGAGRRPASGRGSRRASTGSASTSTSGRARHPSTTRAGSIARSSGCASTATSTSRTAPCGSARPRSVTTRIG